MSDYDFAPDKPSPDKKPEPDTHAILVKTGQCQNVLSLKTGENDPILQAAAVLHADFQAQKIQMGHQHWDSRSVELFKALPEYTNFREVVARSWSWELDAEKAAESIFDSWRSSAPHWKWVNGPCSIWGFAMTFNWRMKVWFATGILADRR